MVYIHRTIEKKFLEMNDFFKVILVTGARQVGKTTMLKKLAEDENRTYVSLDNPVDRQLAKTDPVLFFQKYQSPMILDEVQYAPELFPVIKLMVDEIEETGRFWLTGSQQYSMMKNVQESLAGRIGLLHLYSMTTNEKKGITFDDSMDFSLNTLKNRQKLVDETDSTEIYSQIWLGGMPKVVGASQVMREQYFDSYVSTYLMRDVMELGGVTDSLQFSKFLMTCAALCAEMVNYKTLADSVGIDQKKAKEWLNLLVGLGIIYLLQPYANNELKRLAKTPKLYFADTGLAAHLTMWLTKETLMNGAASGHFFENYVIMELVKNFSYSNQRANFTYFRDSNKKEIDLLVEIEHSLHPLEIKKAAMPRANEVKKFCVIEKTKLEVGAGGIVCMIPTVTPIDSKNCFIPANLL